MSKRLTWAFWCYLTTLALLGAFSLIYLLRAEFMPYHARAIGQSWEQLPLAVQTLILGLMKTTGGGWLATAVAMAIILFKPFKRGETWALWAVPSIGLATAVPLLYLTLSIAIRTPADPPWIAAALGVVLQVVGLVLSLEPRRNRVPPL
ncbi:MAG: hypothetical protein AAF289_14770 [Cyanobacteria bacterium P01_A01_bin.135]